MSTQSQASPRSLKFFVASLLISLTLVAPFIVLQWVNRRTFDEVFPFVLFTFMSLHSLFIVLLLTPALQRLRTERSPRTLKPGHWIGLLLGVFLVYVYVNVVIDQLPCFLGVPNCD
jgi:drug/metabolite transporter (DMT)-like permease